jgi:hypothetical protein
MKQESTKLTKVQKLAWVQIVLIVGQLSFGLLALFNTAQPEPGVETPSINTLNQIVVLLLFAFGIPALLVVISATQLVKPITDATRGQVKTALKIQKGIFVICVVATLPSLALALNGFWLLLADCIFGIISWTMMRKELKEVVK